MFTHQIAAAIDAAGSLASLDALSQAVWKGFAAGVCSEGEAQTVAEAIEARRGVFRAPRRRPLDFTKPPTLFARAKAQRPPDRQQALERRRRLATSGPMPPELACMFTMGELAVLRVVGDEWRDKGRCDRTYAELAARAGVSRDTARNAIRAAMRNGLVTVEERRRPGHKNLPNMVRIVARSWLAWIERKAGSAPRSIGVKKIPTTDNSKIALEKGGEFRAVWLDDWRGDSAMPSPVRLRPPSPTGWSGRR